MTTIYRAGGVKSDTPAGFRVASGSAQTITRAALNDNAGVPFVVTAGKTFYIGHVTWWISSSSYWYLMYDNDGNGTNEVIVARFPNIQVLTGALNLPFKMDCMIPIPAGQHLTAKTQSASIEVDVILFGQEV